MPRLTRRRFLASSAAWVLSGCGRGEGSAPSASAEASTFRHGVASGDPLADRVVLWSHVTEPTAAAAGAAVRVSWQVARDPEFLELAARGTALAEAADGYTVKVDVGGLAPGTSYHYRFHAQGAFSPVGRTRTLPVGSPERVRLAACSCANYPQGYFNAYRRIAAREDLDAVLHLGDYLYEYADGVYGDGAELGRHPEPSHEIVSLDDYRVRHAFYKRDPDLQELHRHHPVIAVWDDHESANNAWRDGAENHQPETEGPWSERRQAAMRAYLEWMPVRARWAKPGAPRVIHRSFRFGDLAELFMLDTRLEGRDVQLAGDDPRLADPARSLLGAEQERWLLEGLSASRRDGVAWQVLGQQVMLAPLALPGQPPYTDAWDGYPAARARLLDHVAQAGIRDLVVLSGDIHSSWALELAPTPFDPARYDPATGRGSLGVELVAPAVSSTPLASFPRALEAYRDALATRPHLRFLDLKERGYLLLDLDRERARAEWWFVDTVTRRSDAERRGGALATQRGTGHLAPA